MAKVLYTAEATVTGEQLFAVGYAACFERAPAVAAGRAKVDTVD